MLTDIQRTVYPEEVTRQLQLMAQARENLPVIDRRSNHFAKPPTPSVVLETQQSPALALCSRVRDELT